MCYSSPNDYVLRPVDGSTVVVTVGYRRGLVGVKGLVMDASGLPV